MNYYERHLGDYAKDAGHLSMLEHGAYTLLLDRYYSTEQALPADQVHRICRARTKEEREAVDTVLNEFFTLIDGAWTKGRVEEDIQRYRDSVPQAEAKRDGARERQRRTRERRQKLFEQLRDIGIVPPYDTKTSALASMLQAATSQPHHAPVTRDDTTTQTPDTSNTPLPPSGDGDGLVQKTEPEGFKAFWDAWPKTDRKQARGKCFDAWRKGKCEGVVGEILRHVEHLKRSPGWTKDNGQFVPAPLVYLNGRRWEGAETDDAPQAALLVLGGV